MQMIIKHAMHFYQDVLVMEMDVLIILLHVLQWLEIKQLVIIFMHTNLVLQQVSLQINVIIHQMQLTQLIVLLNNVHQLEE